MSDYEIMKQFIQTEDYEIKTSLDNLIYMCFGHYDSYIEENGKYIDDFEYVYDCIELVKDTGLSEYDYYC